MSGLARPARDAAEFSEEIDGVSIGRWRVLRRSVADDATALLGADNGQRSRRGMSAAFGATRDVNGDSVAGKRHVARNLGRKRAGCDQSVRAKRRPRTGGDAAARIGWLRNETETSC